MTTEVAELLKFTSNQNQNCRLHPIRCKIRIPDSTPLAFETPACRNGAIYPEL